MTYIFFAIATAGLVALYKFFPNKKIFAYFCLLLVIVFGVSVFLTSRQTSREKFTRAQIEEIRHQQKIFGDWYAEYQKDIDQLDRNWQLYYNIIDGLKSAEIYEYSTYEQLKDLEREVVDEQIKVHNLTAPPELDENCRQLLNEVIKKTQAYADAQAKI